MANIRGVVGTPDGSFLSGNIVETGTMPAGTNPTVDISSPYIRSANDVFHLAWQGDPGVGAPLVITNVVFAVDQAPGKTPKLGKVTVKAYGTTTAPAKVGLLINNVRGQNVPPFQPHKYQT